MLTKKQAELIGKRALPTMLEGGWEIRVWENLGWHVSLYRGPAEVCYTEFKDKWNCLIADDPNPSYPYGSNLWNNNDNTSSDTPLEAYKKERKTALVVIDRLIKVKEALCLR